MSVTIILGAAIIALLCDFLKHRNQQLREAMVELQTRREEAVWRAAPALDRVLAGGNRFTGLVVSIGVQAAGPPAESNPSMRSITGLISGLLGPEDFCCRTESDEFLILCPNQRGEEARRRLSSISERLWDYQLRAMGSFPVLFSCGGIDVKNEPLSEAVAASSERMHRTRRGTLKAG